MLPHLLPSMIHFLAIDVHQHYGVE
jgi:hypothetical protein